MFRFLKYSFLFDCTTRSRKPESERKNSSVPMDAKNQRSEKFRGELDHAVFFNQIIRRGEAADGNDKNHNGHPQTVACAASGFYDRR